MATLDLTEIKLVEQKGDLNAQEAESNWLPVCVNGLSLGWTQLGGRMLKMNCRRVGADNNN